MTSKPIGPVRCGTCGRFVRMLAPLRCGCGEAELFLAPGVAIVAEPAADGAQKITVNDYRGTYFDGGTK